MLRGAPSRPLYAYFDGIKSLRLRQVALVLKAGYDPNLLVNQRGQNGIQFMVHYFGATEARFRLQAPINKSAYLAIGKLLLDSGLDPNVADLLTGETALFDAIRYNDKDMVSLLLNYADLAIRNKEGESALMCAARCGSKHTMRIMLEHMRQLDLDGYFLRQRNRFGLTPLELARAENIECARVLTKHLVASYGPQAAVMPLARSASHHQLAARRAKPPAASYHHASAYVDDSASDECYDADLYVAGAARRAPAAAAAVAASSFDPRAAEFSKYLLEQQDSMQQPAGAYNSTDEDEAAASAGYLPPAYGDSDAPGALVRSRSCMLAGPSNAAKQAGERRAYAQQRNTGTRKSIGASNSPTRANKSSWDANGGGGAAP